MEINRVPELIIIGGGLAGSEAAWQAASRGIKVGLFEMRPTRSTGAHQGGKLAELVCSNSLGSNLPDRAAGILMQELRLLGSLLIKIADQTSVPAGSALAVDRYEFSDRVTRELENHKLITVFREEVISIPDSPSIVASGPLTSPKLSAAIREMTGIEQIFFYDALAPIVNYDSINMDIVFPASRYGKHSMGTEGDYLNCPMSKDQYYVFVEELIKAERINLNDLDQQVSSGVRAGKGEYFEGCLPIEIIASRGKDSLAYGPLRPVGITDQRTGQKSFAVVQLRQDNLAKSLYNIVGFQTNLKYTEQQRVFRMIPGLAQVEFSRYGQMHRNTFIFSPGLLHPTLQYKNRDDLFFAGQITGVEGYLGNIATGWLAGINAANFLKGKPLIEMSPYTMVGALCYYITHAAATDFQPMKANLGILGGLNIDFRTRKQRAVAHAERSAAEIKSFLENWSDE
jgi:methylenetetrahydrofolate--tRNA-(uracil-5-)-methyltransferase